MKKSNSNLNNKYKDFLLKFKDKLNRKENKKKEFCKKLQEQGLKLDGISGFFQDTDFKWTYKSHKGIFIPAFFNNKIQGLRIFLDDKYKKDTENIWFSSNNLYNGTKANNWPIFLKEKSINWIDMYNSKANNTIIIATEIILAHKLFNNTHKTVIGVPNNIDKDILLNIVKTMKATEVFLYVDNYTILHTSTFMYRNIIEQLENEGIKVNFRVALVDAHTENVLQELNEIQEKVA